MPTIEASLSDLEALVGRALPRDIDELNGILSYVKGAATPAEPTSIEDLRIELKDGNRPDLWNVEGIARGLRGFLGIMRQGVYGIAGNSGIVIGVDRRLRGIRPFICCSVVKGVKLTDPTIRGLMQLQEKLDETYGRKRRRTSIGLYDFDLLKPPLRYGVSRPDGFSFVPLGFTEMMTLREILERHPKGLEYGDIIRGHSVWPILYDSRSNVLSLPPVINSNDLGRITEETRNVLVEVTGTSYETVSNTLNIVTLSLADRGGRIYSALVKYPYGDRREVRTPSFKSSVVKTSLGEINGLLGLSLNAQRATALLRRAGFRVIGAGCSSLTIEVPFYRIDIMHPVDVIEDIAIAYGVNSMEPRWPQLVTIGAISTQERFERSVRELMIGFGFQEILTYVLSNPEDLFSKMNLEVGEFVGIANPRIATYTCLRNWLLPSLMGFLSKNTHVSYPQRIFEVGLCALPDRSRANRVRDSLKLAFAIIGPGAGFTEAKSILESLLANLGHSHVPEEALHPSFIEGRCSKIMVDGKELGIMGEVHPKVLESFGLGEPAVALELELWEKLIG